MLFFESQGIIYINHVPKKTIVNAVGIRTALWREVN
jgi:hypothetical protein